MIEAISALRRNKMLFFCEECGSKNLLPDTGKGQKEAIAFRCQACDFENVLQASPPGGESAKQNIAKNKSAKAGRDGIGE